MSALRATTNIKIRQFTSTDYPTLASIEKSCFPEYADTPEELAHYDSIREPFIKWNRFLAEMDGHPVASALYSQRESAFHPQKFRVDIIVHPDWQRQGIGTSLLNHLLSELAPFEPILLSAHAQEGRMGGPEFLRKNHFIEVMRDWESRLNLSEFDPNKNLDVLKKVEAQGITLKSLAELADDPDRDRKLFAMDWQIVLDIPTTDVRTKPTFEFFRKRELDSPDFLPEGWFVALDGDRYVGESVIQRSPANGDLYVGTTGVLPEYRRRGIATALKLLATTFAKNYSSGELKTWNAQSNRAMLSINESMGFVKQPAWISFEKRLDEENENEK